MLTVGQEPSPAAETATSPGGRGNVRSPSSTFPLPRLRPRPLPEREVTLFESEQATLHNLVNDISHRIVILACPIENGVDLIAVGELNLAAG